MKIMILTRYNQPDSKVYIAASLIRYWEKSPWTESPGTFIYLLGDDQNCIYVQETPERDPHENHGAVTIGDCCGAATNTLPSL